MSVREIPEALIIAFSMYSIIPMPRTEWRSGAMKYALCFLPLVGIIEGIIVYGMGSFLLGLGLSELLFAAIMSALPIIYSGGIHMDGFLDTCDALGSYGSKERRLEIMKDSNSGAFAIIGALLFGILSIGFYSEIDERVLLFMAFGYPLSRALSVLALMFFKGAREGGLAATFSGAADKGLVRLAMGFYILLCLSAAFYFSAAGGMVLLIFSAIAYFLHYYNCMHNFGGITGDLAGFFLEVYELILLVLLVVCFRFT